MKFHKNTRRKAVEYEKDWVGKWKKQKTFQKSIEQRPAGNAYVFYDGPPFITGVPHHGTLLTSIVKDAVPRYWTMKGKRVERRWGWDCHGLPAEVFTEKKLGIQDKRDIGTKISLEEYITTCRDNMVQTGSLWEDTIDRIGRWVEFKGAYKTMDKEFMESVWWAFKKLYDAGKIYEGEKVLLYCTRDATPLSKAEVAMDNSYQDVTDPSVYVKFRLVDEPEPGADAPVYLLAWTTTPWTLPANTALAVNKKEAYVEVEVVGTVVEDSSITSAQEGRSGSATTNTSDKPKSQRLILAKDLVQKVLTDEKNTAVPYTTIREFKGEELIGRSYQPLFEDRGKNAHKVWHADYVSLEEGTGIVHLAPAYGEEDYALSRANAFPFVDIIDDNGFYNEGEWKGQYVWDANKPIAKVLHERAVVWKVTYIRHSYPHCHRCGTKLMYRAHPSWFMDINGQRTEMLEQNSQVNWFPEHIKHGRSEKTIQTAPDWNLSRDRFWASAIPVWKGVDAEGRDHDAQGKPYIKVVGSYAELKELSGVELEDYHRPWVDDVTFTIDGVTYKRIEKVLDCWFESGSMPFAQYHYPFENVEKFEQNFPGDFIVEYVPQVRAWFYYMNAVGVGLFGKVPFKTALVHGTIAGNDGRKMSKSFGNYTDPNVLMDQYSADALRFLLLQSPLLSGEDFSLQDKDVADIQRKLAMVWNMYDFFTMYADVDGWEWDGRLDDPSPQLTNQLDQWVVSRVHQLIQHIDEHMQRYDIPNALSAVLPFLDDASNWYVRRSRRRFWRAAQTLPHLTNAQAGASGSSGTEADGAGDHHSKGLGDTDKDMAYRTLHYILVQFAMAVAPFTPFLAEELFQKLTGGEIGESVHLLDWPESGHVNELVLDQMADVRVGVEQGLSQRAAAKIKARQPLQSATVYMQSLPDNSEEVAGLAQIVQEELNVKEVSLRSAQGADQRAKQDGSEDRSARNNTELDLTLTPELKREGLMREVVRLVQNARKEAGLQIDDRILLQLATADTELSRAIREYSEVIAAETLAVKLGDLDSDWSTESADSTKKSADTSTNTSDNFFRQDVTVDGLALSIALAKSEAEANSKTAGQ